MFIIELYHLYYAIFIEYKNVSNLSNIKMEWTDRLTLSLLFKLLELNNFMNIKENFQ